MANKPPDTYAEPARRGFSAGQRRRSDTIMKKTAIAKPLTTFGAVLLLAGCANVRTGNPPQFMTRAKAQQLAEEYAEAHGRDLKKYRLVDAEPQRQWLFFYDGLEQTVGNHFTVIVNEETGKVGMMPGE